MDMIDDDGIPEVHSPSFKAAELRSEWTRVAALLAVFGGLFALVLIRGGLSLAAGRHGEAWPFALLLGLMTVYELIWLRYVKLAITLGRLRFTGKVELQHIYRIALSDGRVVAGNSNARRSVPRGP